MTTPATSVAAVVENPAFEAGVEPRVASAYRHPPMVESSPYSATQMQQAALMGSGMEEKLVRAAPEARMQLQLLSLTQSARLPALASCPAGAGQAASLPLFLPHLQQLLIDRIDNIGYRGQRIVTGHYFRAMGESACCVGRLSCGPPHVPRSSAPPHDGCKVSMLSTGCYGMAMWRDSDCACPPHLIVPAGTVDMANPAPLGFMAFSLATCL